MTRKPLWTEGLLISQHHLQQQDQYFEALVQERIRAVSHYDWGVSELKIDERGFAAGQFRLQRFSAIWPDGAAVSCGEGTGVPAPEPRDFPSDAQRVEVFAALSTGDSGSGLARRHGRTALHARAAHRRRQQLRKRPARGRVGAAQPTHPVRERAAGRLRHAAPGRADTPRERAAGRAGYPCPTRAPAASRPVPGRGRAARVLANIVARQQQLFAERRGRQKAGADFHASEVRQFLLLQTLSGFVPELNHLLDAPRVHPEEAYLALSRLAGTLSCFSAELDPLELPKFNYLELGETFETLFAIILRLVSGGTERAYTEIPLEHRPDGMFIGRIDAKLVGKELFIAVKANMAEALVRERAPAVLKLAGWNHIYDVVKQARTGVKVAVEWSPSGALPVKPGTCASSASRAKGNTGKTLPARGTVALYLPSDGDWAGAEVALYAVDAAALR